MNDRAILRIGSRRELFLDDFVIGDLSGVSRQFHKPQIREKALVLDAPWEGGLCNYASVCSWNGMHYMFYRGNGYLNPHDRRDTRETPQVSCIALSADGVHWKRPELTRCQENFPGVNNIMLDDVYHSHNFSPFIDTKPGVPESERFKALAGTHIPIGPDRYPGHELGVAAFTSGDGLVWSRMGAGPVMDGIQWSETSDRASIPAFWSATENCYVAYFRVRIGPAHLGPAKQLRWIARTTSQDFLNWTKLELVDYDMHYTEDEILANADDGPRVTNEELYTFQVRPYFRAPHMYLSFPNRINSRRRILSNEELKALDIDARLDCSEADTSIHDSLIMISRDGMNFDIPTKDAFLRPGFDRRNWDNRNQYLHNGMIQTAENELSLYFNRHGFNRSSPSTTHFMRCTVRMDGFASINSPHSGGEFLTKPLFFEGRRLEVNYETSAAGSIGVELQDTSGKPIEGFRLVESDLLIGDEVSRPVTWGGSGDVSALQDRPVRILFKMKDADLYSFRFA